MASNEGNQNYVQIPRQYASLKPSMDDDVFLSTHESSLLSEIAIRIKKCLELARHPATTEDEAVAALRMTSRLITHHNVCQTILDQNNLIDGQSGLAIGAKIVCIYTNLQSKRVVEETWVRIACTALATKFDCRVYSRRHEASIEWTFFGIHLNATAAAMCFEMVHLLVMEWSSARRGSKNSYRLGIATHLRENANNEKREEALHAREHEIDIIGDGLKMEQDEPDLISPQSFPSSLRIEVGEKHSQQGRYLSTLFNGEPSLHPKPMIADTLNEDALSASSDAGNDHDDEVSNDHDDDDDPTHDQSINIKKEDELSINVNRNFEEELRKRISPYSIEAEPNTRTANAIHDSHDAVHKGKAEAFEARNPPHREELKDEQRLLRWPSQAALMQFRREAEQAAERYLAMNNIHPPESMERPWKIQSNDDFNDGVVDSHKFNLKR